MSSKVVHLGAFHRAPRQVPLNEATHTMLRQAVSAVTGLPLETVRAIELYKANLRQAIKDLNAETQIGVPSILDMTQDVIKDLSQECIP